MNPITARKIIEATEQGQIDADEKMRQIISVSARREISPTELLQAHVDYARERRSEAGAGECKIRHAYWCGYAATASDFGPTPLW